MERINHHHLHIFWTLARVGTFTKAAYELSIAQSAVTAQIKTLEESLGLTLIDRSNRRRPELTEEGKRVLEYADTIFETSQELLKWATKGKEPKAAVIRVGAIASLSRNIQYEFLKPILADPSVTISVTTGDQDNLIRLLREHALDVVLTSHNVRSTGTVLFYSHVLTTSPLIFVSKTERRTAKGSDLKGVLTRRALYLPALSFEIRPELDAFLKTLRTPLRIAGEIEDIALLRILALRSGAVVALPEMGVKGDIEVGDLKVWGRAEKIEQRYYAITRQKIIPNRVIQGLIEGIRGKEG